MKRIKKCEKKNGNRINGNIILFIYYSATRLEITLKLIIHNIACDTIDMPNPMGEQN